MIRNEIIKILDRPLAKTRYPLDPLHLLYDDLKNLLTLENFEGYEAMNNWFKGVIESLYYKPNKYILVLEGENLGLQQFFEYLWFNNYRVCEREKVKVADLYDYVLIHIPCDKHSFNLAVSDGFTIEDGFIMPIVNKRLASFCSTTNEYKFPQRKNVIVLKVKEINWELYNSINKLDLWIEIFNKFKP